MLESVETLSYLAVLAVIALATVRTLLSSDESPIEEAHRLYSEGKIDEPELERRLGEVVEDIKGVGPKTSTAIAREFESLDDLRASNRERLEDVYGVGEEAADAILNRI